MRKTRILYSDNGTIVDLTSEINNYHSDSYEFADFVASEDYIYVGNIVPFNHFYLKMATASVASTTMTVEYWTGSVWRPVVELMDETNGLTEDGFVTFVPDRNHVWINSDTSGTQNVTGLTSVTIYNKYWIRISFNEDLTDACSLSWIGQIFSNDDDLGSEYPELVTANVKTSFESGKTNWEEQHVKAAELIVRDLIKQRIIFDKGQILERESFTLASVSKVAEIIMNSFGDDYTDQKLQAYKEYKRRLDRSIYDVDNNLDGELNPGEMATRQGFLRR